MAAWAPPAQRSRRPSCRRACPPSRGPAPRPARPAGAAEPRSTPSTPVSAPPQARPPGRGDPRRARGPRSRRRSPMHGGPRCRDVRHAGRRDDRPAPRRDELGEEPEVGPAERPIAVDRGHLEHADPDVGEALEGVGDRDARCPRHPALAQRVPVADVEGHRDPVGTEPSVSRPAKAGSRSAAVPTTTRAAPGSRAAATSSSFRRPPATSTRARSPTRSMIAATRWPGGRRGSRAPSRSTTCSHRAPRRTNASATSGAEPA